MAGLGLYERDGFAHRRPHACGRPMYAGTAQVNHLYYTVGMHHLSDLVCYVRHIS